MAQRVKILTNEDLGVTVEVLDQKLELKISQDADNSLVKKADGLYSKRPELGSMQEENTEDYLTKDEIEDSYLTKDGFAADLSEYEKTENLGSIAYEDVEAYYDKTELDAKIAQIPGDKFLQTATLSEDGSKITFAVRTDEGDTEIVLDVQNLIPVNSGTGVKGDGTTDNPLEVDEESMSTALGLGTMASEAVEDYYTSANQCNEQQALGSLLVTLTGFDDEEIGVIQEEAVNGCD